MKPVLVLCKNFHENSLPHLPLYTPLPDELSQDKKDMFMALLAHYSDILVSHANDLGVTDFLSHHINTENAQPIHQPAKRVPLPHRGKVQRLLNDMLQKNVMSPSQSPWASPVVLVTKKDGSTRFCIEVNEVTRKDAYPIPRVDDTLDTLAGSV